VGVGGITGAPSPMQERGYPRDCIEAIHPHVSSSGDLMTHVLPTGNCPSTVLVVWWNFYAGIHFVAEEWAYLTLVLELKSKHCTDIISTGEARSVYKSGGVRRTGTSVYQSGLKVCGCQSNKEGDVLSENLIHLWRRSCRLQSPSLAAVFSCQSGYERSGISRAALWGPCTRRQNLHVLSAKYGLFNGTSLRNSLPVLVCPMFEQPALAVLRGAHRGTLPA
jgi:hypothetical protein